MTQEHRTRADLDEARPSLVPEDFKDLFQQARKKPESLHTHASKDFKKAVIFTTSTEQDLTPFQTAVRGFTDSVAQTIFLNNGKGAFVYASRQQQPSSHTNINVPEAQTSRRLIAARLLCKR